MPVGFALAICACGCGGPTAARSSAVWANATVLSERDPTDRDDDRPGADRRDPDNDQTMTGGRAPTAAEARAIISLIRRYYAYAAVGNVAGACSLIYAPLLESLSEGRRDVVGSRAARCRQVLSTQFANRHTELVADLSSQTVIETRIRQRQALVRVLFAGRRDRLIRVHGQGTNWKLDDALDAGSP